MHGMVYWIATVSDSDGVYASDLIWGDYFDNADVLECLSPDVRAEAERLGLTVELHGPLTLNVEA